jgi:hypothetical protein
LPICCNNVIVLPTLWLTGKIRYVAFYCLWQLDELWLEVNKCLCSNCLFFIKAENYTWILGNYSSLLFELFTLMNVLHLNIVQAALCLCSTLFIISRLKLMKINQYYRLQKIVKESDFRKQNAFSCFLKK